MLPVYIKTDDNRKRLVKEFKTLGLDPIVLSQDQDLVEAVSIVARTGGRVEAIYLKDSEVGGPDEKVLEAVLRFRKLPDSLTFTSGLKVKSIPIVLSVERIPERFVEPLERANVVVLEPQYSVQMIGATGGKLVEMDAHAVSPSRHTSAGAHVLNEIQSFKRSLLDEFENAGLAAVLEGGSLRIKIALTTKSLVETEHFLWEKKLKPQVLFLGPDLRRASKTLAQYEQLINKKDVSEREMQKFFEKNPEFVLGDKFQQLWSQFVFPDDSAPDHRTDFLLQPQVYPQISTNWEILELKKPGDLLVTRSGLHRGFSQKVHRGIRQLRDYAERFQKNPDYLLKKLGHRVTHPRLALLIGKKMEVDPEVLAKEQKEHPDVRLISYDEIHEEQMRRFAAVFSTNPFV